MNDLSSASTVQGTIRPRTAQLLESCASLLDHQFALAHPGRNRCGCLEHPPHVKLARWNPLAALEAHRSAIARALCEVIDWRDQLGRSKEIWPVPRWYA
ncbi:MAG: hypothetical protein ACYDGN_01675 [Acidimicrobiales bacterium]